jgi:exonuclease I
MWKRKRKAEWLPWYRARNYKGDLTEAEKRQLDAFRMQPKHPAAQEDDLPEEVQSYIGRIEMELYDKKQEGAVGQAMFLTSRLLRYARTAPTQRSAPFLPNETAGLARRGTPDPQLTWHR